MNNSKIFSSHGGYRDLKSFQTATLIHDLTVAFCNQYKPYLTYKTYEQMTGAARSGKQNIAEGSQVSGTSKKTEMKLISVARGSLEELLLDYEDFLRQENLLLWNKDNPRVITIRQLAYQKDKSYQSYKTYLNNPESAANCLICLIHQANFLLDRQLQALEKDFLDNGGFTERLYQERSKIRKKY
jgi:restriction system protein